MSKQKATVVAKRARRWTQKQKMTSLKINGTTLIQNKPKERVSRKDGSEEWNENWRGDEVRMERGGEAQVRKKERSRS